MGRPKKDPDEIKDSPVKILYSKEALEKLKMEKKLLGNEHSLNDFLRDMIRKGIECEREKKAENSLMEQSRRAVK